MPVNKSMINFNPDAGTSNKTMNIVELLPFIAFAKADAIAGAIGGAIRSLTVKDRFVHVLISVLIGGAVAYYLAPLFTILLIMYVKDEQDLVDFFILNARNPIGFGVGFMSIYLTSLADKIVKSIGDQFIKRKKD